MKKPRKTKREKLAELLRAEGFDVHAWDLQEPKGYWRTSIHADVCRWECVRAVHADPRDGPNAPRRPVSLSSWDTMTACVRHGIVVARDELHKMHYDVSARRR